MTFLPIVERELRVAARRRGTWLVRWLAAGIGLGVAFWLLASEGSTPQLGVSSQTGRTVFRTVSALALTYALLAGVRFTADCLSSEKREGTLGLLFLTPLKGYDVVLGKLAANSIESFFGMLALTPVLALPLLLGGMTAGEVLRMALLLLNALLLSLSCGMLVSAVFRSESNAMGCTFLVMLVWTVGLPVAGEVLRPRLGSTAWLAWPSAGSAFQLVNDWVYQQAPAAFWLSLGSIHGLAWLALTVASVLAPRTWQERTSTLRAERRNARIQGWLRPPPLRRRQLRAARLAVNPVFWLARRKRFATFGVWVMLGLGLAAWLGLRSWSQSHPLIDATFLPGCLLVFWCVALKVRLAGWSTMALVDDRRSGALEDLLVTPLSVGEILRGYRLAGFREFQWIYLAVLAAIGLLLLHAFTLLPNRQSRGELAFLAIVSALKLIADTVALFWVGLWRSLKSGTPGQAFVGTVFRVLGVPWLILFFVGMTGDLVHGLGELLWGWLALGLFNDAMWAAIARSELRSKFRELALRSPPPPGAASAPDLASVTDTADTTPA